MTKTNEWVPYQPIYTFNETKNSALILIHPALSGGETYYSFSKYFDPNFSLYALDSYNIKSEEPLISDIPYLAQKYIAHLEESNLFPNYLGGWSLGGNIAFEMAKQYQRMGRSVSKLYIVDAYVFRKDYLQYAYENFNLYHFLTELPKKSREYMATLPPVIFNRMVESCCNDFKMLHDYPMSRYEGSVVLFKSAIKTLFNHGVIDQYAWGWDQFVDKNHFERVTLPCQHFDIFEEEAMQRVAEFINRDIRNYHFK